MRIEFPSSLQVTSVAARKGSKQEGATRQNGPEEVGREPIGGRKKRFLQWASRP